MEYAVASRRPNSGGQSPVVLASFFGFFLKLDGVPFWF